MLPRAFNNFKKDSLLKKLSSLQHPLVKHLLRLRIDSSYRKEHQTLLITGKNTLLELVKSHTLLQCLQLEEMDTPFSKNALETWIVTEEILKKVTGLKSPENYIATLKRPQESDLSVCTHILLCDRIQDPGNMGTLIRSALALGADGIAHMQGGVDLFNEKVLRASKGAIFRIPFQTFNENSLKMFIDKKKWHCIAADPKGSPLSLEHTNHHPIILAIGHETEGLSDYVRSHFDRVAISMSGQMESLNAAVAGSIFMFKLFSKQ